MSDPTTHMIELQVAAANEALRLLQTILALPNGYNETKQLLSSQIIALAAEWRPAMPWSGDGEGEVTA